jgi:hypothetical protein
MKSRFQQRLDELTKNRTEYQPKKTDKVDKFLIAIGGIVIATLTIAFAAVISGTVVWATYPHIHALFPTATIIPNELGWWDSVCITWLIAALFKNTSSSKE